MKSITIHPIASAVSRHKLFQLAYSCALSMAASGCVPLSTPQGTPELENAQTAEEVNERSTVEHDPYRKIAGVSAPTFKVARGIFLTGFYLRLVQSEEKEALQLHILDSDKDWRFYDSAADVDGQPLPLLQVAREVVAEFYIEDVAVGLTDQYLKAHLAGMSVKVWGRGGERIVNVPPFYVEGFLRRLAEYEATAANNAPR